MCKAEKRRGARSAYDGCAAFAYMLFRVAPSDSYVWRVYRISVGFHGTHQRTTIGGYKNMNKRTTLTIAALVTVGIMLSAAGIMALTPQPGNGPGVVVDPEIEELADEIVA